MIHDLKPYPTYKDSGVPWLGEVPEHWEVERLKAAVAQINDQTSEKKTDEVYVALEHVESWTGRVRLPTNNITFNSQVKRFHRDDVLFGKLRPYLAKVTRLSVEGVCVGEFLVLRPRSSAILSPFLENILRSKPIIDVINSSTYGAKMPRADWGFIGNLLLCFPPNSEQSAIVRYLDHIDRRIRRYIRAKQKLIKLLEEQKQAIIHQAVTRGLDPDVKLKPSGDIPEHWEIRRNGRLFAQRNQTGFSELPILEVSLKTGIRVRDFENSTRKQVMSDREKYKRAVKGDIAYNMMRMWQGAVGVAPVDGLISPAYVVARPLDGVDPRYFSNLFRTSDYMNEVDRCSRGIVKDRNRLYWEDFKQIHSPYPPLEEQTQIADAIEETKHAINHAIEQVMHEISLLREYRTRLIADVVTGKLDVRETMANLPEATDETEVLDVELNGDEETTEENLDFETEED